MNLELFQTDLQQAVRLDAGSEGEEQTLVESFTEYVMGSLIDAGEAADPLFSEAHLENPKIQISAVDWDEERNTLTVFTSKYSAEPTISTLTKADLSPLIARAERFIEAVPKGLKNGIEESLPLYEAISFVEEVWPQIAQIRIVVLTNLILKTAVPKPDELVGHEVRFDVWDLERFERLFSSGRSQEPVDIATNYFGVEGIPALGPFGGESGYTAYLAVLPGNFLSAIYEEHGSRLLELNVRSFLQTRNKTNKQIQETLKTEPELFLAYNNGLSMTAEGVETVLSSDGARLITRFIDLQIVNGGQTTASIYHASKKSGIDVSKVLVQAKLSVLDPETRDKLAPAISKYANTQNLIKMADFRANDPFHVELQKLSRSIWAPAKDGSQKMTRWFFERARGQYNDALNRETTPAQKRLFTDSHPRNQLFEKVHVAQYENAWNQLPHIVATGREKNFNEYSQRLAENKSVTPDETYFKQLISKAILWKQTYNQVKSLKLGSNYNADVPYIISLISHKTAMRIDLEQIWKEQDVPELWKVSVDEVAPLVHNRIINSAGSRNPLEWAKKIDCWKDIASLPWEPPPLLLSSNLSEGRAVIARSQGISSLPASQEEIDGREKVSAIGSDGWKSLANWAKESNNFDTRTRRFAYQVGQLLGKKQELTGPQVKWAASILDGADQKGFKP